MDTATSLIGHTAQIEKIAVDKTSQRIATADNAGEVRVWALQHDSVVYRDIIGANGYRSHFSPDGTLFAVSEMLLVGSGGSRLSLRDGYTGELVAQFNREADGQSVWSLAFSPDGRYLAAGLGGRNVDRIRIELWDIVRREWVTDLTVNAFIPEAIADRGRGGIFCLAFSPDGRHLVAGLHHGSNRWGDIGAFSLPVYDVASRRLIQQLEGHRNVISTVAFNQDGTKLVSCRVDVRLRKKRISDVDRG